MDLSRRRFLLSQATAFSGVAALYSSGPRLMAAEEAPPEAVATGSIVLGAAGISSTDGDGRLRSGAIAFSTKDGSWRFLTPIVGPFRLSPDCRRLALLDINRHSIWACDLADGSTRQLADLDGLPVWSPDGSMLMISALPPHDAHPKLAGQTYETWKVKWGGGPPDRVELPAADFVSDWSSDGSWFALRTYLSEPVPGTQIFVCRPDGSERRQLTSERAYHSSARFAPDGKSVVYIRQSKEGSSIWVNSLDGKSPRRILLEPIQYRYQVCWAPDGERIAFTRLDTKANRTTVELVALKTLERTPLNAPAGLHGGCDWRC